MCKQSKNEGKILTDKYRERCLRGCHHGNSVLFHWSVLKSSQALLKH